MKPTASDPKAQPDQPNAEAQPDQPNAESSASPEPATDIPGSSAAEVSGVQPATEPVTGDGAGEQKDEGGSPQRTDSELEIDRRVEEETAKLQEQRRQNDAQELARKRADFEASEKSLHIRALDASLGLVEHLGCRGVYVGKAPQSEKDDSKCPSCLQPLAGGNSKFTPLPYVVPVAGMLVKDSESGEFFALPSDGTLAAATAQTWLTINNPSGEPFVPEAREEGSKDRAKAAGLL